MAASPTLSSWATCLSWAAASAVPGGEGRAVKISKLWMRSGNVIAMHALICPASNTCPAPREAVSSAQWQVRRALGVGMHNTATGTAGGTGACVCA